MLDTAPRVEPLRKWAARLASEREATVPWFDPAEDGIDTGVLIVLEAPGPITFEGNKRPASAAKNTSSTPSNTQVLRSLLEPADSLIYTFLHDLGPNGQLSQLVPGNW